MWGAFYWFLLLELMNETKTNQNHGNVLQDKAKMLCVKLQIIKKDTLNIVHVNACGRANFGLAIDRNNCHCTVSEFFNCSNCFQSISIADISLPTVEFIATN